MFPYCEKPSGPLQHLQVTQWMEYIDGKEKYDAFNSRMEEKQPSTTQKGAKTSPSSQKQQFQYEKETTISEKGQEKINKLKAIQEGLQNPKVLTGFHGKCVSDGQSHD
ncbi:hypothetical protein O181_010325 [Austropuccinia psidii MF-1]|uniref:Uncharacterized protein n=1 Tax=Austropuccinia psidii MF-1 TaxID=1389203 RepID=A0A9Q3BTN1_9BASI|nr:hypothetical protein [Austropuccinia psidii MF-1]